MAKPKKGQKKPVSKAVEAPVKEPTAPQEQSRLEYMKLVDLPPWPRNPKKHEIEVLQKSIMRWGFTNPVLIDEESGRLIAGHGRCEAVTKLSQMPAAEREATFGKRVPARVVVDAAGNWLIPVLRGLSFASEQEAEAYLLADNRTNEIGGWDDEMLQAMLRDLPSLDEVGLSGMGWSEKEISALLREHDSGRAMGPTPEEKLDGYIGAAIKQLVLFFDSAGYDEVIGRLQRVMEHSGAETHTDAFLALLKGYEVQNEMPEYEAPKAEDATH